MTNGSPEYAARQLIFGFRGTHLLCVMAELGIADLLATGPRSSADLAANLEVDADALYRVLRALAQLGVLDHSTDDFFSLSPVGDCLRSDRPDSLRPVARYWGHPMLQRAWGNILYSVRTGQPGFDDAYGMPAFAYLDANPDAAVVYNEGMARIHQASVPAVIAGYDWSRFGTIVDVGSGNGSIMAAILTAHPGPRAILFDLSHARPAAQATIRDAELTGRASFVAGNFFEGLPAGGDCYFLRQIIHDWDDAQAEAILRACRQAIPPHGLLLLNELVLPAVGDPGVEPVMIDVTMLVRLGGRERTEAEYRALLARAGFRLERVIPTTPHAIFECVPA